MRILRLPYKKRELPLGADVACALTSGTPGAPSASSTPSTPSTSSVACVACVACVAANPLKTLRIRRLSISEQGILTQRVVSARKQNLADRALYFSQGYRGHTAVEPPKLTLQVGENTLQRTKKGLPTPNHTIHTPYARAIKFANCKRKHKHLRAHLHIPTYRT